eukprot:TRINITY_DN22989_c0_g1_i1.p1 TRINITY_DN22989_c0_g1~~TRINITY_DN22989_c0_g1_i1.p1  ORF type:complete len:735 (+),score=277.85 TRINITY_DN22989_c0_g1_i1:50-2254(+)
MPPAKIRKRGAKDDERKRVHQQEEEEDYDQLWRDPLWWAGVGMAAVLFGFLVVWMQDDAWCYLTSIANMPEVHGMPGYAVGTTRYNATMLWGSYRPQVYFGMRTREEQSFLFGLGGGVVGDMRYTAEDDQDVTFGWNYHDGVRMGIQKIVDDKNGIELETSFIKVDDTNGGDWVARVKGKRIGGKPRSSKPITIMPTFASEGGRAINVQQRASSVSLRGGTKETGSFTVHARGDWKVHPRRVPAQSEWNVDLNSKFKTKEEDQHSPNQVILKQAFSGDFVVEFALTNDESRTMKMDTGCRYTLLQNAYKTWFENRMLRVFGARTEMVMGAVSNLLGGIGYWYGSALRDNGGAIPAQELFSGVPSRAKFPRGFLWDEGFHQLVVGRWHTELSKDVILSWMSQMEQNGWIAREQIRGPEPRSRVPMEFVPQNSMFANPPTLLLQIQNFALSGDPAHKPFLVKVWPYLRRWHGWFKRSQSGSQPNSFRWRGKNGYHLLPCGLDDYPRSKCNTEQEMHVDLHSWMILMADTMHSIAQVMGDHGTVETLSQDRVALRTALRTYHKETKSSLFSDAAGCPAPREGEKPPPSHVTYRGYVTLFPLLVGALDAETDREEIEAIIKTVKTSLLGEFGIRSLSEKSLKRVKQHDDYWTGPIWMNINYMFLRALGKYNYTSMGPEVEALREELREKLVRMVSLEFERTGKLWENYDPASGRGRGTAPFTGWTALVTLFIKDSLNL